MENDLKNEYYVKKIVFKKKIIFYIEILINVNE